MSWLIYLFIQARLWANASGAYAQCPKFFLQVFVKSLRQYFRKLGPFLQTSFVYSSSNRTCTGLWKIMGRVCFHPVSIFLGYYHTKANILDFYLGKIVSTVRLNHSIVCHLLFLAFCWNNAHMGNKWHNKSWKMIQSLKKWNRLVLFVILLWDWHHVLFHVNVFPTGTHIELHLPLGFFSIYIASSLFTVKQNITRCMFLL